MKLALKTALSILLIIALGTYSCVSEVENNEPEITIAPVKFPVVICNRTEIKVVPELGGMIDSYSSKYQPYYIGKETDSITVHYYLSSELTHNFLPSDMDIGSMPPPKLAAHFARFGNPRNCARAEFLPIDIFVDTTQIITGGLEKYPVRIKNLSEDTACIGTQDVIYLLMEAQDSSGNWKPIEELYRYFCGTGIGTLLLPPNEMLLTGALKYNGTHRTQLRLVLGENVSNTFYGNINPEQFSPNY